MNFLYIFFLYFLKTYVVELELPHSGSFSEYPQSMFRAKQEKLCIPNSVISEPHLYKINVGFKRF